VDRCPKSVTIASLVLKGRYYDINRRFNDDPILLSEFYYAEKSTIHEFLVWEFLLEWSVILVISPNSTSCSLPLCLNFFEVLGYLLSLPLDSFEFFVICVVL